jgi:hypothetical protein
MGAVKSVELKPDDAQTKSAANSTKMTPEVKYSEVMEYFTLQSEYAFVARVISQMDGVEKGLEPDFDFISAAASFLVEIECTKWYLVDEIKKRLKFVYDPDDRILAEETSLFKMLGFEP